MFGWLDRPTLPEPPILVGALAVSSLINRQGKPIKIVGSVLHPRSSGSISIVHWKSGARPILERSNAV
jgi:hypothetical protein